MGGEMAKLSPTRAQLGGRCYRRHALGNVGTLTKISREGVGPSKSGPDAAFGTVIHAMAAEWWRNQSVEDSDVALRRAWANEFGCDTEKYSEEMALGIANGYRKQAEFAPLVPGTFIPIMIEERIEVPIGPHILTFKIDRMLGDGVQDKMVFVDTKTAGRLGAQWTKGWDISLQMKLYKLGVYKKWGKVPDGVIEGVLKKVPTRLEYVLLPDWDMDMLWEAEQQFIMVANQDEALLYRCTREDGTTVEESFILVSNHDKLLLRF